MLGDAAEWGYTGFTKKYDFYTTDDTIHTNN